MNIREENSSVESPRPRPVTSQQILTLTPTVRSFSQKILSLPPKVKASLVSGQKNTNAEVSIKVIDKKEIGV